VKILCMDSYKQRINQISKYLTTLLALTIFLQRFLRLIAYRHDPLSLAGPSQGRLVNAGRCSFLAFL
jgi:hypothetical protein